MEFDQRWHFKKQLSIDTLVQIVGVAIVLGGPILYWGRAMEARVLALEIARVERDRSETEAKITARSEAATVAAKLDKLDEKVTQLQINVGRLGPFASPRTPSHCALHNCSH